MTFGIKEYCYKSGLKFYYLTINKRQVGSVYFQRNVIEQLIKDLKADKEWK